MFEDGHSLATRSGGGGKKEGEITFGYNFASNT